MPSGVNNLEVLERWFSIQRRQWWNRWWWLTLLCAGLSLFIFSYTTLSAWSLIHNLAGGFENGMHPIAEWFFLHTYLGLYVRLAMFTILPIILLLVVTLAGDFTILRDVQGTPEAKNWTALLLFRLRRTLWWWLTFLYLLPLLIQDISMLVYGFMGFTLNDNSVSSIFRLLLTCFFVIELAMFLQLSDYRFKNVWAVVVPSLLVTIEGVFSFGFMLFALQSAVSHSLPVHENVERFFWLEIFRTGIQVVLLIGLISLRRYNNRFPERFNRESTTFYL